MTESSRWPWPKAPEILSKQLRSFLEAAGSSASVLEGTAEDPKSVAVSATVASFEIYMVLFSTAYAIVGSIDIWQTGPGRKAENVYLSTSKPSVDETLASLKTQYESWAAQTFEPRKPDLRLVKSE